MELRLPDITENDELVTITLWFVKENERVSKDQDLVEVMTDKATFSVASPWDGQIAKINRAAGEEVERDEVLAEIRENKDQRFTTGL